MKQIKKFLYYIYTLLDKEFKLIKWHFWTKNNEKIKIVIGASKTDYKGWFQTEQYFLDLNKRTDFYRMFSKKKMNYVLAEHVLEHLTNEAIQTMLHHFREFSENDINIRIAVPDGFHNDNNYIELVKPGGTGNGSDDHKNLFTYKSLSKLFEDAGFKSNLIEYWDENGVFHQGYINDNKGYIKRSFINDPRNIHGKPVYTSLIIDFTKR